MGRSVVSQKEKGKIWALTKKLEKETATAIRLQRRWRYIEEADRKQIESKHMIEHATAVALQRWWRRVSRPQFHPLLVEQGLKSREEPEPTTKNKKSKSEKKKEAARKQPIDDELLALQSFFGVPSRSN